MGGAWEFKCSVYINCKHMPKTPVKTKTAPSNQSGKQRKATSAADFPPKDDLTELLVAGIRQLYWAENHLVQNLPKVAEAAGNNALRKAVAEHWKVTKGHVTRLEKAFNSLGESPLARKCDGMEGLVMEGEGVVDSTREGTAARLTGLIAACQKVENYEITAYIGLALLASRLGHADIAELLEANMAEEQEAENLLTALAEQQ
jgi:ferritin-like metal-binding protein YciE